MQAEYIKALSIKRCYAERIMAGTKKIELRKRSLGMELGDLVLLYETTPDSIIEGGFIADKTLALPVAEMWARHHSVLGVEKAFYDAYFENCTTAYGTGVYQSFAFSSMSLDEICQLCPGFVPPQATINWRNDWYIRPEWTAALTKCRSELIQDGRIGEQLNLLSIY